MLPPPLRIRCPGSQLRNPHGAARAQLFLQRLDANVVDASILVQCVALTLDAEASSQRGVGQEERGKEHHDRVAWSERVCEYYGE